MRVDTDGTFRLSYSGTALAGSQIMAALKPFTDRAFRQATARRPGRAGQAYAADGLLAMALTAAAGGVVEGVPKSNVKVIVVVDIAALRRGEVETGRDV